MKCSTVVYFWYKYVIYKTVGLFLKLYMIIIPNIFCNMLLSLTIVFEIYHVYVYSSTSLNFNHCIIDILVDEYAGIYLLFLL